MPYDPAKQIGTEPLESYVALQDYCYQEWGRSEGAMQYIYPDSKGYPSTGTGLLIYAPENNGSYWDQRYAFQMLHFYQNGRLLGDDPASLAIKGQIFDQIVTQYKNTPTGRDGFGYDYRTNCYPGLTFREDCQKKAFDDRFKQWYNHASQTHPDLVGKMPASLAQAYMHMYWWGKGGYANYVDHNLPYDVQAQKIYDIAHTGLQPNQAIEKDLLNAIEDSNAYVNEQKITRNPDGSATYYTDPTKTTRVYTEDANGNQIWYRQDDDQKIAYTLDTEGNKTFYLDDGQTKNYTEDKKGNKIYYRSDGTRDYLINKRGVEMHYASDGQTVDYIKGRNGNEVHYRPDGTRLYKKYQKGKEIHYRSDGKTIDYIKESDGTEIHFTEKGKRDYVVDKDGNETHYQPDGRTVKYTKDKDGNEVYYDNRGKVIKSGGEEVTFDDNGIRRIEFDGNVVTYTDSGNIATITDQNGYTTFYKENGRVDYVELNQAKVKNHSERKGVIQSAEQIKSVALAKMQSWQSTNLLASSQNISALGSDLSLAYADGNPLESSAARADTPLNAQKDLDSDDLFEDDKFLDAFEESETENLLSRLKSDADHASKYSEALINNINTENTSAGNDGQPAATIPTPSRDYGGR